MKLNDEGIKILPKYCKQIRGLQYSYGGYGGHEIDFINLSSTICLITLTKDVKTWLFVGTIEQDSFEQVCEKWRKVQRLNNGERCTNPFTLAPPQACPTISPSIDSRLLLPISSSHVPLVTSHGRWATWLAQY